MNEAESLREQGKRFRTLADAITDQRTRDELLRMAVEYDQRAEQQEDDVGET